MLYCLYPPVLHADRALGESENERSLYSSLPPVAQSVERLPFKEMVVGSIPTGRTETKFMDARLGRKGSGKHLFPRGVRHGKTVGFPEPTGRTEILHLHKQNLRHNARCASRHESGVSCYEMQRIADFHNDGSIQRFSVFDFITQINPVAWV